MPSKKTKSTRKQYIKQKVKEANDAINEGLRKSSGIINELESEKSHLEKVITDLNSQYVSTKKKIFRFGKDKQMNTLKRKIEQRETELDTLNSDIKNVTKELKPYIRKRKSVPKSKSNSTSKSSSSKSTRRVKFKSNKIVEFDKSDPVDSLLINKNKTVKNKTVKNSK
jgi:predicted  nucleic acid-binding Zn-ribbon protein|uniref:Uncharacterized protein n=1 Tax=viral metagenome TaxID=1070528 RepID=A0A6C0IKR8_9ZZZZ